MALCYKDPYNYIGSSRITSLSQDPSLCHVCKVPFDIEGDVLTGSGDQDVDIIGGDSILPTRVRAAGGHISGVASWGQATGVRVPLITLRITFPGVHMARGLTVFIIFLRSSFCLNRLTSAGG